MDGYTADAFTTTEQAIYTTTLAARLELPNASDVSILSLSDAAPSPTSARRLAQASSGKIRLEFEVTSSNYPAAISARLQVISDDESGLESDLQSAGLAVLSGSLNLDTPAVKLKTPPLQTNFADARSAVAYFGTLTSVVSAGAVVPTEQAVSLVSQLAANLNATSLSALPPGDDAAVLITMLNTLATLATSSSDGLPPQQAAAIALQVADILNSSLLAALPLAQAADAAAATLGAVVSVVSASAAPLPTMEMVSVSRTCAAALNAPDSPLAAEPARAASLRASLLQVMVTQSGAGTSETTPAELDATAGTVASLLSNASQINAAAATSGLQILQSVAGAGSRAMNISSVAASSVTAGLSTIAAAAAVNTSDIDAAAVLSTIKDVVDDLATSLMWSIAPDSAPIIVASHAISMRVDVVSLAGAGARLFPEDARLPGSDAAVKPLPLGVPDAPVVASQFVAFSFDPNDANATLADDSPGVVVLSLRDPDTLEPLQVAGLASLITLALPSRVGDGMLAAPAFWNETLQQYSSAGLTWIPNPAPPAADLIIDWVPGFDATSDDTLPLAWNVSGPAAAGCVDASLDCGVAAQRSLVVETCPGNAASQRWACGARTSGIIRIWTGCTCRLWRVPPGAPGCGWNVSTASFQGADCMTSNVTRVGTRHLTAFTVQASPPEIRTLSAADLVAISPEDLVHVKELLIIVGVLFVGMHILSQVLARLDARDFARLKAAAYSPEMGATRVEVQPADKAGDDSSATAATTEVWTWRFTQDDLVLDKSTMSGLVSGPAVRFAALAGLPYARLACAVPSCMFGGSPTRHAIGRDVGLSPSRLQMLAARRSGKLIARSSSSSSSEDSAADVPAAPDLVAKEPPPLSQTAPIVDPLFQLTLASTALMYALMVSWCMESAEGIVAMQRAFIEHFCPRRGAEAAALARHFLRLYVVFKELFIAGTLRSAKNWLPKGRLLRAILLAREEPGAEGSAQCFWELDEHIAFTLLANNAAPPHVKLGGLAAVTAVLSEFAKLLLSRMMTGESAGAQDGTSAGASTLDNFRALVYGGVPSCRCMPIVAASAAAEVGPASLEEATAAWDDDDQRNDGGSNPLSEEAEPSTPASADVAMDPMSFSAAAILDTMPSELRVAMAHDSVLAGRVWTTALVAAYMEATVLFCWRVTLHTAPASEQRTLVDSAQAWVSARLAGAVPYGAPRRIVRAARARVVRWAELHEQRVTVARGTHITTREHVSLRAMEAVAKLNNAVHNGHPTASLFMSELSIGFARWMGMYVLVSALMSMLVVNIWFYYSKGAVCCDAARTLLDCPAVDPLSPCAPVDFAGGPCVDLVASDGATAAFAGMPDGQYISGGAFVCTAFPADDSARDTLLSGLISFAVSVPLAVVVANCFGLCTCTDDYQLHGRTRWMTWPSTRRLQLGRLRWRWAAHGGAPSLLERTRRFLASWWCTSIYVDAIVAVNDALQRCVCKPRPSTPPPLTPLSTLSDDDDGDTPEAYAAAVDAAMAEWGQDMAGQEHFSLVTTRFKHVGYVVLHLAWGVFAWIIFAYGRLVYNLLGPAAAKDFSNSWGTGVAIGQANDASGTVQAALQALLLATVLETLWLLSNNNWLECYLDFASVAASVAARAGRRRMRDVLATYKRHYYSVS